MILATSQMDSARELAALAAAIAIFTTGIFFLAWWKIFSKAGYSGARSLLLLFPVINVIIFLLFAFSEWPIQRRLRGSGYAAGRADYVPAARPRCEVASIVTAAKRTRAVTMYCAEAPYPMRPMPL